MRHTALWLVVPCLLAAAVFALQIRPAVADPDPSAAIVVAAAPERMVTVPEAERKLALTLPKAAQAAIEKRAWAEAARELAKVDSQKLLGDQKSQWAFLSAWSLVQSGQAAEAKPLLTLFQGAANVPHAYSAVTAAAIHRKTGDLDAALNDLGAIRSGSPLETRATLERAEIYTKLGRTAEGWAIYEQLAALPDPSPGTAKALLGLAERAGVGNQKAYPLYRRVWAGYPRTEEAIVAGKALLSYPDRKPTFGEITVRAERLMDKGEFSAVVEETTPYLPDVAAGTPNVEDVCRFLLARGRSLYKQNELTKSIEAFGDAGSRCAGLSADFGARAQYLTGQAFYRKKMYAEAAAVQMDLPKRYPKSNLADDSLTQAGFSYVEAGDLPAALRAWRTVVDQYAQADTAPEAAFRLAFALYLDGKPAEARDVALRLASLPLQTDAVHVAAGRYWAARWALFPDVRTPSTPITNPAERKVAIDGWKRLCEDLPHSFYSILAWSRLREEAPEVAQLLVARPTDRDRGSKKAWSVPESFYGHPAVREGVALARLGLVREALVAWGDAPEEPSGEAQAWLTELRIAGGDWLFAHEALRKWLSEHPPGTLGAHQTQILRVAYPDRYWAEVQSKAVGMPYEPRLFHALVREESNFNAGIVSHAGAHGLSQVMPATARQVAKSLGIPLKTSQLDDVAINLKLGATYLGKVHERQGGSPYLSLAGYNAGEQRVKQWLTAWGNVPTDEFVERIPFRETRGYVRRVMGSWQTMRWQFDDGPAFYDLSDYNHQALQK